MDMAFICFSCKKSSHEVRILDAVREGRAVKVCESCSKIEDVIVIRRPTSSQLADPNRSMSVYHRLQRLAGLDKEEPSFSKAPSSTTPTFSAGMSDFGEYSIKKRKEMMEKLGKPVNLVEHANWIVQKERRNRRMTVKQLGDAIGVSEIALKMFEEGKIPEDGRRVAEKLEQYLHVKLINEDIRSPGYNRNVAYRKTSYDYTKPDYSRPAGGPSAEMLVEKTPSELPKTLPPREAAKTMSAANKISPVPSRPLPTTRSTVDSVDAHHLPLNAGATSARITGEIQRARQNTSMASAPSGSSKYMVPNPNKIMPASKPRFSLVDDAVNNHKEIPRVQNVSKLAINRSNINDVTLSQLQDIKKERDKLDAAEKEAKESGDWKGEVEFVDLDEQ